MSELAVLPDLRFKGGRTYLHGTDLFQAVTQFLETRKSGYLKEMSFRLFGDRQCAILFSAPDSAEARVICQGCWHDSESDSDGKFWLVEHGAPVSDRYGFDEDALCSGAELTEDMILRSFNSEFAMIENIVALTKKLHNEKLPLTEGKWVFGQIVLKERLPEFCRQIQIENYQNIKDRFSRNRIVLDGRLVGEVRFIVAPA